MPMNRNQRIKKHTQCSPFVWSHTNKPTPLKQLIAHFVFYRSVNCACKWNNAHKFCRFRGMKEKQHSHTQTFTFTCAGSYRMYSLPTIIWHYRKTSKMKTINCMAAHKLFLFALSAKSYTLVQTNSLWLLDTVAKLCYRILAWWRCVYGCSRVEPCALWCMWMWVGNICRMHFSGEWHKFSKLHNNGRARRWYLPNCPQNLSKMANLLLDCALGLLMCLASIYTWAQENR